MEDSTFRKWVNGHRTIPLDPEWEVVVNDFIDQCGEKLGNIVVNELEDEGNDVSSVGEIDNALAIRIREMVLDVDRSNIRNEDYLFNYVMPNDGTMGIRRLWSNEMKISNKPNSIVPHKQIVSLVEQFCKKINSGRRGAYDFVVLETIKERYKMER
jgi:hypothetical protein